MKIHIETYGCAHNMADSETMAGLLEVQGHELVAAPDEADVVVLNTCTVKDASYRTFERRLQALDQAGRKTVVAGCVPSSQKTLEHWKNRVVVGVRNLPDIPQAVELAREQEEAAFLEGSESSYDRLELPTRPQSSIVEIIPINQGCLSSCTFCETQLARGRLDSSSIDAIQDRAKVALERGAKEIWLTSQDTATFGRDRGVKLWNLLHEISSLSGTFRVRLGMANPLYLKDQVEEVSEALRSPVFFRFLHLPLQSGSNAVLRRMKRGYTVEDWLDLCRRFRSLIPDLTIATDIIVGFPGETKSDFEETLDALREIRPEVVNRSKYSARPQTRAADFGQTPGHEIREHSARLDRVTREIVEDSLQGLVGKNYTCLIDQQKRAGSVMARTNSYRPVALQVSDSLEAKRLLGTFQKIQIASVENWHVLGSIVS